MKTNAVLDRREFIRITTAGLAMSLSPSFAQALPPSPSRIKAVAFDGFAIFDPRPTVNRANALFPGRGTELANEWRTRQFEYTWLRTVAGHYADFGQVTKEALAYAANKLGISISAGQEGQLMDGFLNLKAWPDVVPMLTLLESRGMALSILANLTPQMMHSCVESSGLQGHFKFLLSTDQVQAFKPDPRAYAMGTTAFKLDREEILFVASAGWDAAGSKLFGYPTYWVNRPGLPAEELGATADATFANLNEVAPFIQDRG